MFGGNPQLRSDSLSAFPADLLLKGKTGRMHSLDVLVASGHSLLPNESTGSLKCGLSDAELPRKDTASHREGGRRVSPGSAPEGGRGVRWESAPLSPAT